MAKAKAARKAKKEDKKRGGGRREEGGLMSSAGLMRYYDVEESAVKFSPKAIVIVGVAFGAAILVLELYYGVWPI
jgi:preprotein translocase subunit Sec61beta